jgi:hypothetical protein
LKGFLHGILEKNVYTSHPPCFQESCYPHYVCKLDKDLYGAPRVWYSQLSWNLQQLGLFPSRDDISLCIRRGAHAVYVLMYVDDIIIIGSFPDVVVTHLLAL